MSGQVRGRSGQPAGGIIVEFRNLAGYNVHTTTDLAGRYALTLPADVYVALALDDNPDSSTNYRVSSGNNSVSVPPSTHVDFIAS